jgi:nucleotide-binding universal stress UspA family protein
MKTILVPIDFSRVSRRVVSQAAELARATGAHLVLLHVVKPTGLVKDLAPLAGGALEFTNKVGDAERRKLRQIERRLSESGLAVETICEPGKPVDVIRETVQRLAPTYVVMGSHGHTALYNLMVGSTTGGLLKHARCAVVIVPAKPTRAIRWAPLSAVTP